MNDKPLSVLASIGLVWEHLLAWPGRLLRLPMRREIQYNPTLASSGNRHLAEEDSDEYRG